jgi:hypothetical protein
MFRLDLDIPVQVEEKVDGSQISFGTQNGELFVRSKGAVIHPEDPQQLFKRAVDTIIGLHVDSKLTDGWMYRGEAICGKVDPDTGKVKHNTLTYDRMPEGGVVIFDIETSPYNFLDMNARSTECARIGLENIPVLGQHSNAQDIALDEYLAEESYLGGPKVEGIVLKPIRYDLFATDGKMLMAKYVSEAFKEKHSLLWKKDNPGRGDIIANIGNQFRTTAAWNKAIQRRRDAGELLDDPKDIGPLLKDLKADLQEEWREDIKQQLYKWAIGDILRGATKGFPEWYKRQLAAKVLGEVEGVELLEGEDHDTQ